MRTMITMTKMTALKIKMAKMGPKKAPKNTPISSIKHLGGRKGTQIIKSECHGAVLYIISNLQSWVNNSIISSVGLRTTRSSLTASERSTASGIATGMIGTTGEEFCVEASVTRVVKRCTFHPDSFLVSYPDPPSTSERKGGVW